MKTIAIDFDGVVHDFKNPPQGQKLGPPIPGALESIERLRDQGYKIVIFSHWANSPENILIITRWLDYFDFPPYLEITDKKPNADFFVDDRALEFKNNWPEIMERIEHAI